MYDVVSKFYPHGGSANVLNPASIGDSTLELNRETILGQINSVANYNKAATVAIIDPFTQEMTPP